MIKSGYKAERWSRTLRGHLAGSRRRAEGGGAPEGGGGVAPAAGAAGPAQADSSLRSVPNERCCPGAPGSSTAHVNQGAGLAKKKERVEQAQCQEQDSTLLQVFSQRTGLPQQEAQQKQRQEQAGGQCASTLAEEQEHRQG